MCQLNVYILKVIYIEGAINIPAAGSPPQQSCSTGTQSTCTHPAICGQTLASLLHRAAPWTNPAGRNGVYSAVSFGLLRVPPSLGGSSIPYTEFTSHVLQCSAISSSSAKPPSEGAFSMHTVPNSNASHTPVPFLTPGAAHVVPEEGW